MSLDYDKIRAEEESPQTSMSAYSDLFAALAFVFLFLYVISTIQLSLQTISSKLETQKLEAKLEQYEMPSEMVGQFEPDETMPPVDYEDILVKLAALEEQTRQQAEEFYEKAKTLQKSEKELISQYQTVVEHVKNKNTHLTAALVEEQTASEAQQKRYEDVTLINRYCW